MVFKKRKASVCQEHAKNAINKMLAAIIYPQARKKSSGTYRIGVFVKVVSIVPKQDTLNCS